MDGDDFSRATRLGCAAAEAVRAASSEAPFDGFATARLIDHFVALSGGIRSLPAILSVLEDLRCAPLLMPTQIDEACKRVNDVAHGPDCGMLDLHLGSVAQSAILRGQVDATTVIESFICSFVERHVIMGRGGLVEIVGLRHVERARELTAPIARRAAAELIRRPDAQLLNLARAYRITEQSNLLEA